jgi:hypothetical protein
MKKILLIAAVFVFSCILFSGIEKEPKFDGGGYSTVEIEISKEPRIPNITVEVPGYLSYEDTVSQLKTWHEEAPDLTSWGTYGKSSKGVDLHYSRITNHLDDKDKPKVLITGAIHGNEPVSSCTEMGYIGTILSEYGKDEKITELVNTRDIYFIPIVSPDTYPNSRHVDGVDPNRNFPTKDNPDRISVPPVKALQDFYNKHKFDAVISGHTSGRVFFYPWGDQRSPCPDRAAFREILIKMRETSNYSVEQMTSAYGTPIYGTASDWYYRQGVFAICMEFGTVMGKPPSKDYIKKEFDLTYDAVLYFIKEAPIALHQKKLPSSIEMPCPP